MIFISKIKNLNTKIKPIGSTQNQTLQSHYFKLSAHLLTMHDQISLLGFLISKFSLNCGPAL